MRYDQTRILGADVSSACRLSNTRPVPDYCNVCNGGEILNCLEVVQVLIVRLLISFHYILFCENVHVVLLRKLKVKSLIKYIRFNMEREKKWRMGKAE